jgi:hypothetical protein
MINETKQTAVDWLYNQRIERPLADWDYLLQQAKEMEKEQIIDFAVDFYEEHEFISPRADKRFLENVEMFAQHYYNETYGGNK